MPSMSMLSMLVLMSQDGVVGGETVGGVSQGGDVFDEVLSIR